MMICVESCRLKLLFTSCFTSRKTVWGSSSIFSLFVNHEIKCKYHKNNQLITIRTQRFTQTVYFEGISPGGLIWKISEIVMDVSVERAANIIFTYNRVVVANKLANSGKFTRELKWLIDYLHVRKIIVRYFNDCLAKMLKMMLEDLLMFVLWAAGWNKRDVQWLHLRLYVNCHVLFIIF